MARWCRCRTGMGMKMSSLLELYWTFVKIGCVTFGGGYAMLPILERELVDKRQWTTMDELRDYFSIGQCTPGVIALNVSTFIGQKRKGAAGAVAVGARPHLMRQPPSRPPTCLRRRLRWW